MENKTEELKTILIELITIDLITDVYRGLTGDDEPYVRYNTEKASLKILKLFNTEQIKKEAVEDFVRQLKNNRFVDNNGLANNFVFEKDIDTLLKQYLEKGQNE